MTSDNILGHQIVGTVSEMGPNITRFKKGDRVGVPWLGKTCGTCDFCISGTENLCDSAAFTGLNINGGFANFCVANADYGFLLPEGYSDTEVAPLLCAGMIGYRAYQMAKPCKRLGLYGFGAAARLMIQLANYEKVECFAFTRPGDKKTQQAALEMNAVWAGSSDEKPPAILDAALLFAPVGELVPLALDAVRKGGSVISAEIHMSDIPSFPYELLWGERILRSVANLTRRDGEEFLKIAPKIPIKTVVTTYPLEKINEALMDLREGKIEGSAVIIPS